MEQVLVTEARERIDRWIEEGQYLTSRLLPGFLQEHERLRSGVEAAEREMEKLKHDINGLRKEMTGVRNENQYFRTSRAETAEACNKIINQMIHLLNEMSQALRVKE